MRTVCGLDVHKDSIFVCILNENGILFQDKIGVLTPDLERLVDVLHEHGATEVCMESTSIYWMPVWRILESYFSWGAPKVIFCSHLDTVPPYIAPHIDGSMATGRGTCDAKGQIFAMWEACKAMEDMGMTDFGLLLLAGEETGSFGAKAFNSFISSPSSVISSEAGNPRTPG